MVHLTDEERKAFATRQQLIDLSLRVCTGPWGGCDVCHEMEDALQRATREARPIDEIADE